MKIKILAYLSLTIPLTVFVFSCKKLVDIHHDTITGNGRDIYLVGNDSARAAYWKNGVETILA